MAVVGAFRSVKEEDKPLLARRYHNTDTCEAGRKIPENERTEGNGRYALCEDCAELKRADVREGLWQAEAATIYHRARGPLSHDADRSSGISSQGCNIGGQVGL